MNNSVYYDPKSKSLYAMQGIMAPAFASGPGGLWQAKRVPIGPVQSQSANQFPTLQRKPFTPNQTVMSQLGAMQQGGGMSAPQWMMNAYTRKIQGMGGNANAPVPFGVNQSGFPGMGGKASPTQG